MYFKSILVLSPHQTTTAAETQQQQQHVAYIDVLKHLWRYGAAISIYIYFCFLRFFLSNDFGPAVRFREKWIEIGLNEFLR